MKEDRDGGDDDDSGKRKGEEIKNKIDKVIDNEFDNKKYDEKR